MCNVDVPVAHLSSPCLPEPIEGPRDGYSLGTMIGAQLPLFGGPQGYAAGPRATAASASETFRTVSETEFSEVHMQIFIASGLQEP